MDRLKRFGTRVLVDIYMQVMPPSSIMITSVLGLITAPIGHRCVCNKRDGKRRAARVPLACVFHSVFVKLSTLTSAVIGPFQSFCALFLLIIYYRSLYIYIGKASLCRPIGNNLSQPIFSRVLASFLTLHFSVIRCLFYQSSGV